MYRIHNWSFNVFFLCLFAGVTPVWIVVTVLLGSMLAVIISVPVCFFSFWYLYRFTKHVFFPSYIFPQHLKEVCSLPNTIKIGLFGTTVCFSKLLCGQTFSLCFAFFLCSWLSAIWEACMVGALKNPFCCLLLYIYCVW